MNVLAKGGHSMRIIALPLARVRVSRRPKMKLPHDFNADTTLVFYHFDLMSPSAGHGLGDLPFHKRVLRGVMNKATDIWTGLGKAPKGSWKLWTYELGERVADRIDFEELALRNVDPSLGPTVPLTGTSKQVNAIGENSSQLHPLPKIPLIYPPSLYPAYPPTGEDHAVNPPLAYLQTLLASRGPRHRRGFYLWMFIAPLTLPMTIIPVIPNLPLFFCVWRSWSHYRAYRSSRYLSALLDHGFIEPHPSLELDELYTLSASPSKTSRSLTPPPLALGPSAKKPTSGDVAADKDRESDAASGTRRSQSECILLTRSAIPHILKMFRLPESTIVNLHRAMDQACGRLGTSSFSRFP